MAAHAHHCQRRRKPAGITMLTQARAARPDTRFLGHVNIRMNHVRILFTVALMALATAALAQYPSKPVKIIVPFAAGGTGDIVARIVALKITEQTGKSFIVENRPGAAGRIGYEITAKSPGDGYVLAATDATYTMLPGLYGTLGWDQANDLVPVTISARAPFVIIVNPSSQIKTLAQLLEQAKANPGKVTYGSAGVGSVNHVVTEMFKREAKVDLLHVPYKGMGDAMTGLLTGSVDMLITAMPTAVPQITGGKAVPLAVTSPQRSPALPNGARVRRSRLRRLQLVRAHGSEGHAARGDLVPAQ
jgi:tripartite-type tricarboxylate transporter receptor subunit TctC